MKQQLKLMAYKQRWSYFLAASSAASTFSISPMCLLSRYAACQKYFHESGIQKAQSKQNRVQKQKEIIISKTYNKAAKTKSNTQELPTPPWLKAVHKQLMKSVVLPLKKQGMTELMNKHPHSLSCNDLISLASTVKTVDKETMKIIVALWRKLDTMTIEEILTAADVFFLGGVHAPWYISAMITYMNEMFEFHSFTPLQLTRLVFHIHKHGSGSPQLLNSIEERLCENLQEFSINEVAVICQLYFIGQCRIKSPILVDKIATKLLENLDLFHKGHFPMLMKMFRFSNFIKVSFYKDLGDRLVATDYFSRVHAQSQVMHIALAYASVRVSHPELFRSILKQFQISRSWWRLKDTAKIIWACGTLVTDQEEDITRITNILKLLKQKITAEQVKAYPDNLVDLLIGLAFLNIYPHDLINMAFDPVIVKILFGLPSSREKFFQLKFLDQSISLECPNYSGLRLTEADLVTVNKYIADQNPEVDVQLRKSIRPAVAALEEILGSDCVQCGFVLSHFYTSDILVTFDTEKKLFVPPVMKPLRPYSNDEQVCNKRTKDLVILLLSRAQSTYDKHPLGTLHCKIRQLRAMGYLVIQIGAEEALSYVFSDKKTIQRLLLGHISTALEEDVSKYVNTV